MADFFNNCTFYALNQSAHSCDSRLLEHWTGGSDGGVSIFLSLACYLATYVSCFPAPHTYFTRIVSITVLLRPQFQPIKKILGEHQFQQVIRVHFTGYILILDQCLTEIMKVARIAAFLTKTNGYCKRSSLPQRCYGIFLAL